MEAMYEAMIKKSPETFTKIAHTLDDLKERHEQLLLPEVRMYIRIYIHIYIHAH